MRFSPGDLIYGADAFDLGVAIWSPDLQQGIDTLRHGEIALVVTKPDEQGYTRIMTSRGTVGVIHKTNIFRV